MTIKTLKCGLSALIIKVVIREVQPFNPRMQDPLTEGPPVVVSHPKRLEVDLILLPFEVNKAESMRGQGLLIELR